MTRWSGTQGSPSRSVPLTILRKRPAGSTMIATSCWTNSCPLFRPRTPCAGQPGPPLRSHALTLASIAARQRA